MTEKQEKSVRDAIVGVVEKVMEGAEFSKKELPEAFCQYLRWRFIESLMIDIYIMAITAVLCSATFYAATHGWFDVMQDPSLATIKSSVPANWFTMIAGILIAISAACSVMTTLLGLNIDFIKVKVAPKAIAMEYCSSLLD